MFEGSVDLEKSRHDRAAWVERLEQNGKLEGIIVVEAKLGQRLLFYVFGYVVLAIGVFLLIGGVVNGLSLTW